MSDKITDKEIELATRANELREEATRPDFPGGGLLSMASKFLAGKISRVLIMFVLSLYICFHAWQGFNDVPQMLADLTTKQAEAGKAIAEANALGAKIGAETVARATLEAELSNLQAEARTADADAKAQAAIVNGATVRVQTIRAEIAKTQAEADAARAEADALLQNIGGSPAAVAQKRAEVEQLESEVDSTIETLKFSVQTSLKIVNDPMFR